MGGQNMAETRQKLKAVTRPGKRKEKPVFLTGPRARMQIKAMEPSTGRLNHSAEYKTQFLKLKSTASITPQLACTVCWRTALPGAMKLRPKPSSKISPGRISLFQLPFDM